MIIKEDMNEYRFTSYTINVCILNAKDVKKMLAFKFVRFGVFKIFSYTFLKVGQGFIASILSKIMALPSFLISHNKIILLAFRFYYDFLCIFFK